MTIEASVVLDIGKTNSKLSLLSTDGRVLEEQRRPNAVLQTGPYPHLDVEGLWPWMLATLNQFGAQARIAAIVPVTHGATAALVDEQGLTLPVLDYEFTPPEDSYRHKRPAFAETLSPELPAGLNLGRQLAWLAERYPAECAKTRHVLMYPQYWAWRFSGVAASELTSLGCHTDLWNPQARTYSSLVSAMGWGPKFPSLQPAWAKLGPLLPEIAAATGLPADCQIICGIHDSNASLLRYLGSRDAGEAMTVLSTGTWLIAASLGAAPEQLDEHQDMLANVDVHGNAVACMRFMGGREFGELAGGEPAAFSLAELQMLINQGTLALPCFAEAGGPLCRPRRQHPGPSAQDSRRAGSTRHALLRTDDRLLPERTRCERPGGRRRQLQPQPAVRPGARGLAPRSAGQRVGRQQRHDLRRLDASALGRAAGCLAPGRRRPAATGPGCLSRAMAGAAAGSGSGLKSLAPAGARTRSLGPDPAFPAFPAFRQGKKGPASRGPGRRRRG